MSKRIEIQEHGVMFSDYFHGTSGVWLNVYIDNDTTVNQVIENLETEINMVFDHIEFVAENHEFTIEEVEKGIDEEISKMKAYVNTYGNGNNIYHYNNDFI